MCDLAEVRLRRNEEMNDLLRLLAALAGDEEYETPAERVADMLAESVTEQRRRDPEARRAEVAAFLLAAGGDG